MIHVMLPEQYLAKSGNRHIDPQKRLMLAVLQTVVDDFQGSATRRSAGLPCPSDPKAYQAAWAYVASTDRSWPFTFENLCDALGLDAGCVRQRLTGSPTP